MTGEQLSGGGQLASRCQLAQERSVSCDQCVHEPVEQASLDDGSRRRHCWSVIGLHQVEAADRRVHSIAAPGATAAITDPHEVAHPEVGSPGRQPQGHEPGVVTHCGPSVEVSHQGPHHQVVPVFSAVGGAGGEPSPEQPVQLAGAAQAFDVVRVQAARDERGHDSRRAGQDIDVQTGIQARVHQMRAGI